MQVGSDGSHDNQGEQNALADTRNQVLAVLREDWRTYSPHPFARAQFHVLALHRLGRALGDVRGRRTKPLGLVRSGAQFLVQTFYGVELTWQAQLGHRVRIGHVGGIVIAKDAVIGDDCIIRQNVTIGAVADGGRAPRVGNRVHLGAGAVVIGDIEIGDDVLIGPNAVVTVDVPAGSRVFAAPSRIIAPSANGTALSAAAPPSPEAVAAVIKKAIGTDDLSDPDVPLLSTGRIDSLNLLIALDALESAFGLAIPAEGLDAESFDTARQISAYISANLD